MRKFLFIIIALTVAMAAKAYETYEVTATKLNVRVSASDNATIIGTLAKGDRIEVIATSSGWAKIRYKGAHAFVSNKYLRPLKSEKPAETVEKSAVAEQKEKPIEHPKEKPKPRVTYVRSSEPDKVETLLSGPFYINNRFELYYGLSAGAGFSSFMWDGELVSGSMSYSADLFVEFDFNQRVSFIPRNYFVEFQLGYDHKGATWYPMDYIHARLYPFGYKFALNPVKLVAKAGVYFGFPLNNLESHDSRYFWNGNFQIGVAAAIGVEYKQFGISANVGYCFTEVANTSPTLNNIAIFGTFSYKFGKLLH